MVAALVLGIDIGGSGIKAAPVDLDRGRLAAERRRVKTPVPAAVEPTTEAIERLVSRLDVPGIDRAGVGFPGVILDGVVRTAVNLDPSWIGCDLADRLGRTLGRRVAVINDADAAGLAEMRFGAGRGAGGLVVMITLGTGIGTALFHRGTLIPNAELGHIEMRGVEAEAQASAAARTRDQLSWKRWSKRVEHYLETLDRLLWPDLFIIGGGVSSRPDRFLPRLDVRPPLVAAELGNDAGIIGAALFAAERPAPGR